MGIIGWEVVLGWEGTQWNNLVTCVHIITTVPVKRHHSAMVDITCLNVWRHIYHNERRLDTTHIYIVVTWPWYAHYASTHSEECNLWEKLVGKMFACEDYGQIWSRNGGKFCRANVLTVKGTKNIYLSVLLHRVPSFLDLQEKWGVDWWGMALNSLFLWISTWFLI